MLRSCRFGDSKVVASSDEFLIFLRHCKCCYHHPQCGFIENKIPHNPLVYTQWFVYIFWYYLYMYILPHFLTMIIVWDIPHICTNPCGELIMNPISHGSCSLPNHRMAKFCAAPSCLWQVWLSLHIRQLAWYSGSNLGLRSLVPIHLSIPQGYEGVQSHGVISPNHAVIRIIRPWLSIETTMVTTGGFFMTLEPPPFLRGGYPGRLRWACRTRRGQLQTS